MIALLALLAVLASGMAGVSPAKAGHHGVGMMMTDCPDCPRDSHGGDKAQPCGMVCCFVAPTTLLPPGWTLYRQSHVVAAATIRDDLLASTAQTAPNLRPPIA
jgi:hypothetical protein